MEDFHPLLATALGKSHLGRMLEGGAEQLKAIRRAAIQVHTSSFQLLLNAKILALHDRNPKWNFVFLPGGFHFRN